MKNLVLKSLLLFVLSAFLFSSCDELGDITFDTDFELDPITAVALNGNPINLQSSTIDASKNAEYQKYKSKIKSIKVNKITYTITDVTIPNTRIESAQAVFNVVGQTANTLTASVSNISIVNGATGEFTAQPGVLEGLGDIILNQGQVAVRFTVDTNAAANFKLVLKINGSITAKAIE